MTCTTHSKHHSGGSPLWSRVVTLNDWAGIWHLRSQFVTSSSGVPATPT